MDLVVSFLSFDQFRIKGFVLQVLEDQGLTGIEDAAESSCPAAATQRMIVLLNPVEAFHGQEIIPGIVKNECRIFNREIPGQGLDDLREVILEMGIGCVRDLADLKEAFQLGIGPGVDEGLGYHDSLLIRGSLARRSIFKSGQIRNSPYLILSRASFSSIFIRLRQNTPRLAAGMNGEVDYGAIRLDTPPLAVGSFIAGE
jgi:hypothetical protein